MGKGPSVPETQTVINKTELPPWLDQGGQDIFRQAQQVGANLPAPYQGNLIPDFNDFHHRAWEQAQAASGAALPGLWAAQQGALNSANYTPQWVNGGSIAGMDLSPYMNPFTQQVEQHALGRLNDQRQISQTQIGDAALQSGGAWGSRHGVREGVMDAEFGKAAGELSAGLRAQNFQNAQNMAQGDLARSLQGQMANQGAGLEGARLNQQGSFLAGNLAQMLQQSGLQGASVMESIADRLQTQEGQRLAQQAMQYEQMRNWPLERLQIPMQAIGAIPHGQTTTTTGPSNYQQPNMGMQMLGGMSTGLSIAKALGAATMGTMGAGAGIGALLPLLFSDENEKTDIQKVGKDPETGVNLYAYRYKGDPKSYPKVVGPMAQEIEKKFPDQVKTIAGKKAVNLGFGPMQRAVR
jgi:hypothetical protein